MKKRTKKTLAVSGKVLLRLVLASVLCLILYFSMMMIGIGLDVFSYVEGYQIHEETESGKIVLIEEHTYAEGEEHITKEDIEDNQVLTEIRAFLPHRKAVLQIVTQVFMLIILAIFPYHILWEFGNRDDTKVRYKGQRPDPLRGYRVGAFAMIPFFVLWLLLVLAKCGVMPEGYTQVYRLANIPFMPFIDWVMPAFSVKDASVWQIVTLLVMLLYIPIVCGVSYRLGHRQFSIREHLVFAKKKEEIEDEI